jgi:hypothetical protein
MEIIKGDKVILITIMTIIVMADDDDERFIGYLTGGRKP